MLGSCAEAAPDLALSALRVLYTLAVGSATGFSLPATKLLLKVGACCTGLVAATTSLLYSMHGMGMASG